MWYKMEKLTYIKVDRTNIDLVCKIQSQEWPNYPDRENYENAVANGDEKNIDFIVYLNKTPIGITGVYVENIDKKSIWLDWYCVIPEYRGKGYGKQILLDTIKYCQQFEDIDYFRLDTNLNLKRASSNLYLQVMDFIEKYTVDDTESYKSGDYICTKCLKPNLEYVPWNNRNLHLHDYYSEINKE